MKIRELIEKLNALDLDMEVLCYTEDEDLLAKNHGFRLLHIESVDVAEGEWSRTDDGLPSVRFERTPTSQKKAVLGVTGSF